MRARSSPSDAPVTLGPVDTARALWVLTRDHRSDGLAELLRRFPSGAVIWTPLKRFLVTASETAVRRVLVSEAASFEKGLGQSQARHLIGDGVLTADGDTWRAQRKDLNPHLAAKHVQPMLTGVRDLAARLAPDPRSRAWVELDVAPALAEYTLRVLSLAVGVTPPDAVAVRHAFEVVQDEAIVQSVTQGFLPLRIRPAAARRVRAALAHLTDSVRRTDPPRGPAWAGDAGMMSLLLAGYETTAATLSWACHFLAARPDLQERLAQEGSMLRAAPTVDSALLGRLEWSLAVFKEASRVRPPVWLISRVATAAVDVDGVRLRPGDEVLVLPTVANRDGWADADRFRPERHVEGEHGRSLSFGLGPRACPGGALSEYEAVIWLATTFSALEMEALPGGTPRPLARMSQNPGHTAVRVRSRRSSDAGHRATAAEWGPARPPEAARCPHANQPDGPGQAVVPGDHAALRPVGDLV